VNGTIEKKRRISFCGQIEKLNKYLSNYDDGILTNRKKILIPIKFEFFDKIISF